MKAFGYKTLLAAGALVSSGVAWACADTSCYPTWKLFGGSYSCESRGFLAPGNDTRVNLLYLVRDRGGVSKAGLSYPKGSYDTQGFGNVFLDPYTQGAGFYAEPNGRDGENPRNYGTRCANFDAASEQLIAAMRANRSLPAAERDALIAARKEAGRECSETGTAGDWPSVASPAGREFLGYMKAGDAFYTQQFDTARSELAALAAASDPWVRETAAYLSIRVELAAAQVSASGEYGEWEPDRVDKASVKRGLTAIGSYLKTWPTGRYAGSAQGLLRRALWFAGDNAALAKEYERALNTIDPSNRAAADLVFEVDNKWLFGTGASDIKPQGPMLLAVLDLMQMRKSVSDTGEVWQEPKLTAEQLDAQKDAFAGQPELFSFLQATHAFYLGNSPRKVLQLIPDDARQPAYTNLAFSRQVLRGQALAALKDRNEEGFWLELLGGAKGLWQRPTVELALAMNWERSGKLAQVFAKGSPIQETMIRRELIIHSASPAMLRTTIGDSTRGEYERDLATFVLLRKDLGHGDYAAFANDIRLVRPGAGTDGYMYYLPDQESVPVGLFTKGKWTDGYKCPSISQTARTLSANPNAVGARLCLGDFWRLNGFDGFEVSGEPQKADELGGVAQLFPGTPQPRSAIYTSIIADPTAAGPDKAYALYRAVMCYAPSGYNGCGGKDVPKSQRKAWYDQLKAKYPTSPWAKKLRYYW